MLLSTTSPVVLTTNYFKQHFSSLIIKHAVCLFIYLFIYLFIFNEFTLTDDLHGNYIRTICELTGEKIKNKQKIM